MSKPIFRFAPSPNGYLHTGHAYSALFTWDAARQAGGQVLLRIEDIDLARCRAEYRDQIYDDLTWLGLSWPQPVRIQSEHFDDYRAATAKLRDKGLLFPCFCTRKQIAENSDGKRDPDNAPRYPGTCRHLSSWQVAERQASGKKFSLRLDMTKAIKLVGKVGQDYADLKDWGDVVLIRKDIPTSYHLSVVVDDALQNITHVTRGMDMFAATAIHILLQNLLDLPTPKYQHHKLVEDDLGRKLAKSKGDKSLKALREDGMRREEFVTVFGDLTASLELNF